jgi:HipA N-terminal domain
MRQAKILYKDQLAGILTEGDDGYEFCYQPEYLASVGAKGVSLTLPLQGRYIQEFCAISFLRWFDS